MSDLHFFLNLYPLLPKNDNKKILNNFRLKLIMSMGQDRIAFIQIICARVLEDHAKIH